MGISLTNTAPVNEYKLDKYGPRQWCRVLEVATISKIAETTKKISKTPPKDPLRQQIRFKPKMRVRDYLMTVSKTDPMVGVAKNEVNQVLGSSLTVSTQRVELTTSKVMVLEEDSMLAKSRSEEGSQSPISQRGVVLEEHSLYPS